MATKPTVADSAFATDSDFSSGPAVGTPTKIQPTTIVAQGWRPGDTLGFVGAWFNFLLNQAYLWFLYLDDLHNSADFLNKSYTWLTGVHRFTNGLRSAGVGLESGEVTYVDGSGSPTPRARSVFAPLVTGTADWFQPPSAAAGNKYLQNETGASYVRIPVSIPSDATLTSVRVLVDQASSTGAMVMKLFKLDADKTTPYTLLSSTQIGSTGTHSGTPGFELLTTGTISEVVDNSSTEYWIEVQGCSGASGPLPDRIHWAEINFDDVGPRNF